MTQRGLSKFSVPPKKVYLHFNNFQDLLVLFTKLLLSLNFFFYLYTSVKQTLNKVSALFKLMQHCDNICYNALDSFDLGDKTTLYKQLSQFPTFYDQNLNKINYVAAADVVKCVSNRRRNSIK